MSLSGLSSIFTWGSICFTYFRFRMALKAQGRTIDELSFTSLADVWISVSGVILKILVLAAEFGVSLFPTNKAEMRI